MMLHLIRVLTAYGLGGMGVEVALTGIVAAARGDKSATGRSYLWMAPAWSGGLYLVAWLYGLVQIPWIAAAIGTVVAYVIEFSYGMLLKNLLGKCPWHYTGRYAVLGVIRLDFFLLWYGAAVAFWYLR